MQSENSGINRSSYSPNAAKQVQPLLASLLETGKDVYISSQETGFTPNTLYVKFNDGFKFIIDNFDDNKYVILRSRIAFRKLDNGILAYFKDVVKNRMTLRELEYEFNDSIRWKNELEAWYKTAKDSELFERSVAVNPDDKEWIYNLVSSDSEVEVTESKVRVMK